MGTDSFLTQSAGGDTPIYKEAEFRLQKGCHRFFIPFSITLIFFEIATFIMIVYSLASENDGWIDSYIFHAYDKTLMGFMGYFVVFTIHLYFLISGIIAKRNQDSNKAGFLRFGWTALAIYHIIGTFLNAKRFVLVVLCAVMARETLLLQNLFIEQSLDRIYTGNYFARVV